MKESNVDLIHKLMCDINSCHVAGKNDVEIKTANETLSRLLKNCNRRDADIVQDCLNTYTAHIKELLPSDENFKHVLLCIGIELITRWIKRE